MSQSPFKCPMSQSPGQCFSSTRPIMKLGKDEYIIVDDVECPIDFDQPERGSFNFTDGCGFACPEVFEKVKLQRSLIFAPSAIQVSPVIRLGWKHKIDAICSQWLILLTSCMENWILIVEDFYCSTLWRSKLLYMNVVTLLVCPVVLVVVNP